MAKLKAPLMSFDARGQLGKSLVFSGWKGIKTVRQHVTPANPKSTAQVVQRGLFANSVTAWRSTSFATSQKTAWNKAASVSGLTMSGFNLFSSNATRLQAEDPDASIVLENIASAATGVVFSIANLDDLGAGDEAGDFTLYVGSSPTEMVDSYTTTVLAGEIDFNVSADYSAADVVYCQVRKAGTGSAVYARSGIMELTLS